MARARSAYDERTRSKGDPLDNAPDILLSDEDSSISDSLRANRFARRPNHAFMDGTINEYDAEKAETQRYGIDLEEATHKPSNHIKAMQGITRHDQIKSAA